MCKMLIAYYQAFLEYAAGVHGTLDEYPRIPSPVIQFLTTEHFIMKVTEKSVVSFTDQREYMVRNTVAPKKNNVTENFCI